MVSDFHPTPLHQTTNEPPKAESMIKVYVAGSSRNLERPRRFIARVLANEAMQLTHNWVPDIDAARSVGAPDDEICDERRAHFARTDLHGIDAADVVVFLMESGTSGHGSWVELGYALASAHTKWIIVSGGGRQSIFTPAITGFVDFEITNAAGAGDFSDEGNDGEAFLELEGLAESLGQ